MIRNALLALLCLAWLGALVVIASGPSGGPLKVLTHPATAGWAQAIGAFVAILGAVWISRRDQQHRMESKRTEDLERSRIVVIHARRLAFDVLRTLPGDLLDPVLEARRWTRVRVKWEVIATELRRIDLVTSNQFRAQLSINGRFAEILELRKLAAEGGFTEDDIGVLEEAIIGLDTESRKLLGQRLLPSNPAKLASIEQMRTRDRCLLLADMLEITASRLEARFREYVVMPDWCSLMSVLADRRRGLAEELAKRPLTTDAAEIVGQARAVALVLRTLMKRLKQDGRPEPLTDQIQRTLVQLRWTARRLRRLHHPHGINS